jgi:hypothetical protein
MWPFIKPINLIRYLMVWRINSSLVWQPNYLPLDISLTLGSIISNRLPVREAASWRKALAPWNNYFNLSNPVRKIRKKDRPGKIKVTADAPWPLQSVIFAYPGKHTYGEGELILWELKLLGESADHNLFLEYILPAIEDASQKGDMAWHNRNSLWGNFDAEAIYVARGVQWEPVALRGQLDLNVRPSPVQWAEGFDFDPDLDYRFNRLAWLTPFDFGLESDEARLRRRARRRAPLKPTLQIITDALLNRMAQLLPKKYATRDDALALLDKEAQEAFDVSLEQAARIPVHHQTFNKTPAGVPGRLLGQQDFPSIPRPLIPYLQLASILHIGQHTHYGCGTFSLENYR